LSLRIANCGKTVAQSQNMPWIHWLGLVFVWAIAAVAYWAYRRDLAVARTRTLSGSRILETQWGPIEYGSHGEGSRVLVLHGTSGGWDQRDAALVAWIPSESYYLSGLSGARWEAIFTTCVWSSVSQASTPIASASERPSLTAASWVGDVACGALGMTLISCSRTAVGCETRTSPDFAFDNDFGFISFDTISVWAALAIRAVPFST
jgi:hypothetical protein